MNIENNITDQEILKQYEKQLPTLIFETYPAFLSGLMVVLILFSFTDIFVRQIPSLVLTRIAPFLFMMALLYIRYSKYKNNVKLVVWINNLFSFSMFSMGFGILFITFYTEVFNASISALILITVANYFFVKGKKSIILVFVSVFLLALIFLALIIKPTIAKWQELMNPTAVYLGVFLVSILAEKSRFKEFFYKIKLGNEKEITHYLYQETLTQNEELEQQKEEILSINEKLEIRSNELQHNLNLISDLNSKLNKKNCDTTASITYASRIQEAILPTINQINQVFPISFVFYKPCDIVGGDFYWVKQLNNKKIIAVADCTGHGVPGAFMSILGMSLLHEIVMKNFNNTPGEVLNQLRTRIIESLHQTETNTKSIDGMDIGLCFFDIEKKSLQYAGAYHSLVVIKNNELFELKGDKMPIGKFIRESNSFTTKELEFESDEVFYIYSDGFQDQLGGSDRKRYMSKRFKEFLFHIHQKDFRDQHGLIEKEFMDWKNLNDQLDDILVVGFKVGL